MQNTTDVEDSQDTAMQDPEFSISCLLTVK